MGCRRFWKCPLTPLLPAAARDFAPAAAPPNAAVGAPPCLQPPAAIPGSPPSASIREWTDPAFTCEVLNAFPAKAVADVEEARVSWAGPGRATPPRLRAWRFCGMPPPRARCPAGHGGVAQCGALHICARPVARQPPGCPACVQGLLCCAQLLAHAQAVLCSLARSLSRSLALDRCWALSLITSPS